MSPIISDIYSLNDNVVLEQCWTPVLEQLQEGVVIFDEQMRILKANQAWHNFSHAGTGDLTPHLYPEDLYSFVKEMQSQLGKPLHIRFIDHLQALAWFEATIQKIELEPDGTSSFRRIWCMIAREQTDLVKARSVKDAQQRMLKGVLQRMPMMMYRSRNNRDWTMEYVSEGCQRITGHNEQELLNTPLYGQLIHPDDREYVWQNIQQALEQHGCFHIRYRLMDGTDHVRWVQEIGQGVYSDSGMVLGIDGIVFQTQAETLH